MHFARLRTKHSADVVDTAGHDVEKASGSGDRIMSDSSFEEMASIIELNMVGVMGPAGSGLNDGCSIEPISIAKHTLDVEEV